MAGRLCLLIVVAAAATPIQPSPSLRTPTAAKIAVPKLSAPTSLLHALLTVQSVPASKAPKAEAKKPSPVPSATKPEAPKGILHPLASALMNSMPVAAVIIPNAADAKKNSQVRLLAAKPAAPKAEQLNTLAAALLHSMPVAEVLIPNAADAGPDGIPRLPEVSKILLAESSEVKTIDSQAEALENRVAQAEKLSAAKVGKQMTLFERKLTIQEESNLKVVSANAKVSSAIEDLKKENSALEKQSQALRANNHALDTELHFLKNKLGAAMEFVDTSISMFDESKNPSFLQVSEVDDADEDTDDSERTDDDETDHAEAESFLQIWTAPKATPENALDELVKDVSKLKQQEQESEKSLKQRFMTDYKAGSKRRAALILRRKQLNASQSNFQQRQTDLKNANAKLLAKRTKLQERLQRLSHFLQGLAQVNKASVSEVPRLLKTLPKNV